MSPEPSLAQARKWRVRDRVICPDGRLGTISSYYPEQTRPVLVRADTGTLWVRLYEDEVRLAD